MLVFTEERSNPRSSFPLPPFIQVRFSKNTSEGETYFTSLLHLELASEHLVLPPTLPWAPVSHPWSPSGTPRQPPSLGASPFLWLRQEVDVGLTTLHSGVRTLHCTLCHHRGVGWACLNNQRNSRNQQHTCPLQNLNLDTAYASSHGPRKKYQKGRLFS